jgi:plasmid stabilization system protein ParE
LTQIIWSDFAIGDRELIFDYIACDSVAAAIRIDNRIREHVEMLAEFAEMGREGRVEDTRELVIARTS